MFFTYFSQVNDRIDVLLDNIDSDDDDGDTGLCNLKTEELDQILKESDERIAFTGKLKCLLKMGMLSVEQVQLMHWTGVLALVAK